MAGRRSVHESLVAAYRLAAVRSSAATARNTVLTAARVRAASAASGHQQQRWRQLAFATPVRALSHTRRIQQTGRSTAGDLGTRGVGDGSHIEPPPVGRTEHRCHPNFPALLTPPLDGPHGCTPQPNARAEDLPEDDGPPRQALSPDQEMNEHGEVGQFHWGCWRQYPAAIDPSHTPCDGAAADTCRLSTARPARWAARVARSLRAMATGSARVAAVTSE